MAINDLITRGYEVLDQEDQLDPERRKHLMASEVGNCIREAWYNKHSNRKKAERRTNGYAMRGKVIEAFMVKCLRRANAPLIAAGEEQVSLFDPETRTGATPDGWLDYGDEVTALEFKSFDPRSNTSKFPKKPHVEQLKLAMFHIARHTGKPVTKGVIIYINASDLEDRHEFEVDYPDAAFMRWASARARKAFRRNVDALDREGKALGTCQYCAFTEQCGVKVAASGGSKKAGKGTRLHVAAASYLEAKDREDAAKADKKKFGEEIKADLERRKTRTTSVDGIKVSLSAMPGKKTMDKAAMEADGIDPKQYEKTGNGYDQLSVSRT